MRLKKDEIRIQYVFWCKTDKTELCECAEGSLHWINNSDLNTLNSTFTTNEILCKNNKSLNDDLIEVGIVEVKDNVPIMNWSSIEDWSNPSFI